MKCASLLPTLPELEVYLMEDFKKLCIFLNAFRDEVISLGINCYTKIELDFCSEGSEIILIKRVDSKEWRDEMWDYGRDIDEDDDSVIVKEGRGTVACFTFDNGREGGSPELFDETTSLSFTTQGTVYVNGGDDDFMSAFWKTREEKTWRRACQNLCDFFDSVNERNKLTNTKKGS